MWRRGLKGLVNNFYHQFTVASDRETNIFSVELRLPTSQNDRPTACGLAFRALLSESWMAVRKT